MKITFEEGYTRLQEISRLLNGNPSVDETIELLREGKSIEAALRQYLADCEKQIDDIEQGQGLLDVTVVAAEKDSSHKEADTKADENSPMHDDASADKQGTSDFSGDEPAIVPAANKPAADNEDELF